MDAQREYDRFGPWVIEISADDPPPPLFVPHLTRADPTLLSVKIPRDVDRRATQPGVDLYDYLICLHADDLVVHQRVGREVRTEVCRYRDVQQVRVVRDLLLGHVHLGLPGRSFDLPYSSVSDDLMSRLVDIIRQRYARADAHVSPVTPIEVREGELSFLFDGLLARDRRAGTGMRLVAAQGTVGVGIPGMTVARRLAARMAAMRLLESIHLTDGRELMIVGRGRRYATWWQGDYGADACYIPLANIRGATWHEDAQHGALELVLRTGGGVSRHAFARDNPSIGPYAAFLSSLPQPSRATEATERTGG